MNRIAKVLGTVAGLALLGGCVGPYDSYGTSTTYYGGGYGGYYEQSPYSYDYYGPSYYSDRPYYGGGGGYRAYNPRPEGGNRRGDRDGRRDGMRGEGRGDGGRRPEGQASRPPQQQQQQSAPRAYVPPNVSGVSGRSQAGFGPQGASQPAPQSSAPAQSGWYGFQGRNPNDPNNTD